MTECGPLTHATRVRGTMSERFAGEICSRALRDAVQCAMGGCTVSGIDKVQRTGLLYLVARGRVQHISVRTGSDGLIVAVATFSHLGTLSVVLNLVYCGSELRDEEWGISLP